MGSKILVVDDHEEIREIVNVLLSSEGYTIIEAKDGMEALVKVHEHPDLDLVILDIMMPKMDGYHTCVKIREQSNVPILFLSAKGMDGDKTLGFSSGGDDYLSKPFSYNELTGRVKALLRRYQVYLGKKEIRQEQSKQQVIQCKAIVLDEVEEKVLVEGEEISLTDLEFQILQLLMRHPHQMFSVQHLYETIWKETYYYGCENTVMVHIRNLRKKIEKDAAKPRYIRNVWGKGYRFD